MIDIFEDLQSYNLTDLEIMQIEVAVKYSGYIKNQENEALKLQKLESLIIPDDIDYLNMHGLALEARQKLDKIRPINLGQASRISGVNPSDITILSLNLNKRK